LYWADAGGRGVPIKIASVNLDGSESKVIIKNRLNKVVKLACDNENKVLYWTEGLLQKVNICLIAGSIPLELCIF